MKFLISAKNVFCVVFVILGLVEIVNGSVMIVESFMCGAWNLVIGLLLVGAYGFLLVEDVLK